MGGAYLPYGNTCTVQTPQAPLAQLQGACGTLTSPFPLAGQFSTQYFATPIPGATNFAYRVTGTFAAGITQRTFYKGNAVNNFYFSWMVVPASSGNFLPNTVYTIEVAYYAGQWEGFGPACYVKTGASIPRYSPFVSEELEVSGVLLNLSVYPNPLRVNEPYLMELQGISKANQIVQLSIYDPFGKQVYRAEVVTAEESTLTIKPEIVLAPGVYIAEAQVAGRNYRVKFVVN